MFSWECLEYENQERELNSGDELPVEIHLPLGLIWGYEDEY